MRGQNVTLENDCRLKKPKGTGHSVKCIVIYSYRHYYGENTERRGLEARKEDGNRLMTGRKESMLCNFEESVLVITFTP